MTKEEFISVKAEKGGSYRIISPDSLYGGKTYSEWIQDWFNCYLCADLDRRNHGRVVFLHSTGLPRDSGITSSENVNDGASPTGAMDELDYSQQYLNYPNVRLGGDRLQIFVDQAVLLPILTGYAESSKPNEDWGVMQDYTGAVIDNGDNPPRNEWVTIDGEPIKLTLGWENFRVVTPVFTAVVPDAPLGRSLKDHLEMPIAPGNYPVIVEGYFLLLKFNPGLYLVHSMGSAGS